MGAAVTLLGHDGFAFHRDGLIGTLRYLGAVDHRRELVEQPGQATDDAGFGLAAFTEQDDVLEAENGIGELRYHRIVVTHDARETAVVCRLRRFIRLRRTSALTGSSW